MHLYYYLLALVGLAIYVVNQRSVFLKQCWLLLVEECKVDDVLLSLKKAIEEVEQQRFRQLLSEDSLETDIGERINVFLNLEEADSFPYPPTSFIIVSHSASEGTCQPAGHTLATKFSSSSAKPSPFFCKE